MNEMDAFVLSRRAVIGGGLSFLWAGCASLSHATTVSLLEGRLEFSVSGDSGPAVIFLHGLGIGMQTWSRVLGPIGEQGRALAWNRPGYGASAWRKTPRLAGPIGAEMEAVAGAAGLAPPFVLVGHSLGGLYAQAIAQRMPERVAALILVDPFVIGQSAMLKEYMPVQAALIRAATLRMNVGARHEFFDSARLEDDTRAREPYRAGPVRIIRARHLEPTASSKYVEARRNAMADLAQATQGEIIDAPTGHFVQDERPDIVIDTVLRTLSK